MKKILFACALAMSLVFASCTDTAETTVTTEAETTRVTVQYTEITEPVTTAEPVVTTEPVTTVEPVTTAEPVITTEPVQTTEPAATTEPPVTTEPEETAPFTEPLPFDFGSANLDEYVTLGKYFGIEVFVPPMDKVTDDQIKEQLDGIVRLLPDELWVTEGACKNGDMVNINYVGRVDGKEFAGSRGYGQILTLGEGVYFDGFEEGIVGMNVGEMREITVTVEDYLTEVDGKKATFEVTLNHIYPTLTDEIIAEFVGFETLDEFVSYIRNDLESAAAERAFVERSNAAWTKVMANSYIAGYPKEAVDAAYSAQVAEYMAAAEAQGTTYEKLLVEDYGITVEEAEEMFKEIAKNNVAQTLLLYAVARDMGIDTSDGAYEEPMLTLAETYGFVSVDDFLSATGYTKSYVKELLIYDEVLYAIVEKANFIETEFD